MAIRVILSAMSERQKDQAQCQFTSANRQIRQPQTTTDDGQENLSREKIKRQKGRGKEE